MLPFYETQLITLVIVCAIWIFVDHRLNRKPKDGDQTPSFSDTARSKLMRQYLIVFAIVMGQWRIM